MKPLTHAAVMLMVSAQYGRHGAFERRKQSAPEMMTVAEVFRFAPLFGQNGFPTAEQFLGDYFTTIGPVVFVPDVDETLDPLQRLKVRMHELKHVTDWYKDPFGFPVKYLGAFVGDDDGKLEPRAVYEESAIGVAVDIHWLFTGEIPRTRAELGHELSHGYGLRHQEVELAGGLLEQHATSLKHGIVVSSLGREIRDWCKANDPELLHAAAR